MKYGLIQLRPNVDGDGWQQTGPHYDGEDRKKAKTVPTGFGFYHFPRSMGPKRAFNKLKHHLIKKHEQEISRLEKSLNKLKEIEYVE